MTEIKTKRLILREWEQKDKKDLIEGINNLKVSNIGFPVSTASGNFCENND